MILIKRRIRWKHMLGLKCTTQNICRVQSNEGHEQTGEFSLKRSCVTNFHHKNQKSYYLYT